MVFGKRSVAPAAAATELPTDPRLQAMEYPWKGKSDWAACNFALGHLAINVKQRLIVNGRLHAETLLVGIGAIAGFCAQCAVTETMIKTGRAKLGHDYLIRKTSDGGLYMFGDALNSFLVPEIPGRLALWPLLAGAVAQAGVPIAELPEFAPLFRAVAASIGTHKFGIIAESGDHAPMLQPLQALNLLWPLARKCLTGKGLGERDWGHADFEHWPAIAAFAAHGYIGQMKDVLDPRIAAKLVMEAAIITSKVQPTTVVDGQF